MKNMLVNSMMENGIYLDNMKRYLLILFLMFSFMLVGCSKKEVLKCKTDEENHIFTFEKGRVIKWTINNKEQSDDVINVMNKDNLNGITDNDKSIDIIKSLMKSFYGTCK